MNREQAFMEAQIMYGGEIKKLLQHIAELQKQLEETKQTGSYQVMLMCQKENILLNQQLKLSQKQLAMDKLEKIKNYFDDSDDDKYNESEGWIITNRNVVEYVNNQIKELEGDK